MSVLGGFFSLGSRINKTAGKSLDVETEEGAVSDKFPELELDMKNEDLAGLTKDWKKRWLESEVYTVWEQASKDNENYWKGKQFAQPKIDTRRQLVDNVIFEGLETFLPQVTRRNPDPMVMLSRRIEQSEKNLQYAADLQKDLAEVADEIVLRLKLKKTARHWAIYLLGALKVGWDMNKDIPTVKVVRAKKLILDPDATVDEDGYTGKYIGEHRKMSAGTLIDTLKAIGGETDAEKLVKKKSENNSGEEQLGTDIGFIEWWTDEYMCWTMDDKILLKKKNPHWNYDTKEEAPTNENGEAVLNEEGEPEQVDIEGINHLPTPKMPIVLLSVFNLGKQPVDDTSSIGQNLANQDLVNKRVNQIDKNADSMNGGMVVSLERSGMTLGQATKVTEALRKGGTIAIPSGSVNDAVARMSAPALPTDIYTQLQDTRSRMRDIFGVRGSSAAGLQGEKTVRGKLQNRSLDTDRIGGGFSEYLEQAADQVYNWFVQLLYVYDDNYNNSQEKPKVRVSVKEGSLLPKDNLSLANQAIELAGQNRMSLVDLYKALDYPNPNEMAANVWLQENSPETLLNDDRVKQVLEDRAKQDTQEDKPVSKSLSFKDLPPSGQAQLAKQAGIELHPEAISAFNATKAQDEVNKEIITEAAKKAIPDPNKSTSKE